MAFNLAFMKRNHAIQSVAQGNGSAVIPTLLKPDSVESYRLLALNILSLIDGGPTRAITVFGARKNDDSSLVARNLAEALDAFTSVLLVDGRQMGSGKTNNSHDSEEAEARRPVLNSPGSMAIQLESEISPEAQQAMEDGTLILIDAPAAEISATAFMLAMRSGNALYVMRHGQGDLKTHERAIAHLRRLGVQVLGIVLNDH